MFIQLAYHMMILLPGYLVSPIRFMIDRGRRGYASSSLRRCLEWKMVTSLPLPCLPLRVLL